MQHIFNVEVAKLYGIEEAIILENIFFWCSKNKANGTNFKNGKYWTYNSIKAFVELFPYMNDKKIIRTLKNLEDNGLIETGCFNPNPYDRTKWYAITNKGCSFYQKTSMDLPKMVNQDDQSEQMIITDINTDNKPDINTDTTVCVCEDCENNSEKNIGDIQQELFTLIQEHNSIVPKTRKIPISTNFTSFVQKESRLLVEKLKDEAPDDIINALKNFLKVAKSDTWQTTFTWTSFVNRFTEFSPEYFALSKFLRKTDDDSRIYKTRYQITAEKEMEVITIMKKNTNRRKLLYI